MFGLLSYTFGYNVIIIYVSNSLHKLYNNFFKYFDDKDKILKYTKFIKTYLNYKKILIIYVFSYFAP